MRSLFVLLLPAVIAAATPLFDGPYLVMCGSQPVKVSQFGTPTMGDLTGDGKKDLVIGELTGGYVRCYPNIASDSSPQFDTFFYVEASGSRVTLPNG